MKKAGIAIPTSDKIDLKVKIITRDKEGYFIILKGSMQQKDKTLVNIYGPDAGALKYINKTSGRYKGSNWQQYNHSRRL